jgi:hypothetical protein
MGDGIHWLPSSWRDILLGQPGQWIFCTTACRCECGTVHHGWLGGEAFYPACCNQDGRRRAFVIQCVDGDTRAEVLAKLADGVSVKAEPYV